MASSAKEANEVRSLLIDDLPERQACPKWARPIVQQPYQILIVRKGTRSTIDARTRRQSRRYHGTMRTGLRKPGGPQPAANPPQRRQEEETALEQPAYR